MTCNEKDEYQYLLKNMMVYERITDGKYIVWEYGRFSSHRFFDNIAQCEIWATLNGRKLMRS